MTDDKTNILVVDDLPEKLLAYQSILEELGQNVIAVRSGEEALAQVLRHEFAVILLDVNMPPGMNGFETASLIRKRRRSALTPIIFLTAFADEVRAAEGYAHGAVDYIPTPVVPAILRAKVRVFVELYRMTQQVKRQADERIALAEERTKRAAAEEANRWLSFLAQAGAVLGQSLDHDITARVIVGSPIPVLADAVTLVIPQETTGPIVFMARPGEESPRIEEYVDPDSIDQTVREAIAGILDGRSTPSELSESGTVLALPFKARGRTFAALALSRPETTPFGSTEITVAKAFVSRAAIALDNARLHRDVEEANRQKNEFLSMLAHELRNPLAPIRNAVQVLELKADDAASVAWVRDVIDRQLTHLVRLVDDLLDVSRITQGKIRLQLEPIDLCAVIARAVESSRPLIDQSGHQLDVDTPEDPILVNGDGDRLTQVVTNLLNNAAKYTENAGRIRLSARAVDQGVTIRVRDTGIGIPAEMLTQVFELFAQANRSLDRSQGGLGIGLTLVRRLVEMHGGTVQAFSDGPGRGSEFVVHLPRIAQERPDKMTSKRPESVRNAAPLRIAVVDDNVDGVESMAQLLRLIKHEVAVAHDGPTAIDVIRAFQPDAVILDIGLPLMDGYEVARRLRADPLTSGCVLIALSGYGRDEDRQQADEAGFDHHLVKPVEFAALQKLLNSVRARGGSPRLAKQPR